MTAPRSTEVALGRVLRRYWWVVLGSLVFCGAAAALLAPTSQVVYSATGSYIVPAAGQAASSQRSPYDAERLAGNYAVVLTEDQQLLLVLADQMQVDFPTLRDRLTAVPLPSSSAVRVTYSGPDESEVLRFFTVLTEVLARPSTATPNIISGTLRPLQLPTNAVSQGTPAGLVLGVALLAGALIGVATAVALERSHPRVDGPRDLRDGEDRVVLELGRRDAQAEAELAVVRLLSTWPDAQVIAVVAVSGLDRDVAERTARELTLAWRALSSEHRVSGRDLVEWHAAALTQDGLGERAAQDADVTVLLVPKGVRRRAVEDQVSGLADLGARAVVLVVVTGRYRRGAGDVDRLDARPSRLQAASDLDDRSERELLRSDRKAPARPAPS